MAQEPEDIPMAEMTISLRCDPATGKKNIIVTLHSDEDALPLEHEQQHRALVDKLLNGGLLKQEEVGNIIVEREDKEKAPSLPAGQTPQDQRQANKRGG
jgi:FtsH ternary system domain X3-analog